MDTSKVDIVQRWPIPTKTIEVQQFVGFMQYVRKFIKHFSVIAATLTSLTKAKTGFKWTALKQDAFEKLKEAVCSQPVLKSYKILLNHLKSIQMLLMWLMVLC